MEGRHLTVSLYPMPPYIIMGLSKDKITLRGYLGEIWHILQDKLNFTSDYFIEQFEQGVDKVRHGHRDVLLRPIVVTSEDVEAFDYTVPVLSSWYQLYVKDSDEVNSSYSYIRNWSIGLWLSTVAVVMAFALLLFVMLRLSSKYLKHVVDVPTHVCELRVIRFRMKGVLASVAWRKERGKVHRQRVMNEESLGNCFMTAIANFCSQGSYIQSHVTSIRILVLSFLVFGMIMSNSYSALLVSQLTLRERYLPFNTLEELADTSSGYSLCVREESYPHNYFTVNYSSKVLKKKWSGIVNKPPCVTGRSFPHEILCASHVAFLESPEVMREQMWNNKKCQMSHLKGKYLSIDISVLILHGFEDHAKGQLNKKIMRLRETGILQHLRMKWVRQDEVRSPADDPMVKVSYDHIEGVLYIYGACIVTSIAILLAENAACLYKSVCKKKH